MRVARRDRGATLLEYTLLLILVAMPAWAVFVRYYRPPAQTIQDVNDRAATRPMQAVGDR